MKISELFLSGKYKTDKYALGYFDNFYDEFLAPMHGANLTMLEIGVKDAGSIKLWRQFFGPESTLYGGDINHFKEVPGVISVIGDLYSDFTAASFPKDYFDLIIDDGPHTPESFNALLDKYYSHLKPGGYIVIEDVIDKSWVAPLVQRAEKIGYSRCDVMDMTGKQKRKSLLRKWRNGLFILKVQK